MKLKAPSTQPCPQPTTREVGSAAWLEAWQATSTVLDANAPPPSLALPSPRAIQRRAGSASKSTRLARRGFMGLGATLLASSACAWVLYPERRGQNPHGSVDVIPLVVDILWFLPGLIPGAIFLAVDFVSGAIYTNGASTHRKGGGDADGERRADAAPPRIDAARASQMVLRVRDSRTVGDSQNGAQHNSPIHVMAHSAAAGATKHRAQVHEFDRKQLSHSVHLPLPINDDQVSLHLEIGGQKLHLIDVHTREYVAVPS